MVINRVTIKRYFKRKNYVNGIFHIQNNYIKLNTIQCSSDIIIFV